MAASVQLLHHLLFFKTPPPLPSLHLIKPLSLATSLHLHKPIHSITINPLSLSSSSRLPSVLSSSSFPSSSSSYSSLSNPKTLSPRVLLNEDQKFELDSEDEVEQEEDEIEEEEESVEAEIDQELESEPESEPAVKASSSTTNNSNSEALKLPKLSVKEKKELASYAHSLGKKLKCQQVGKSGVTSSLAAAFVENLESNELLKLKIHNSCPGELADVVKQLEEATGSVAVGLIGRAVILYRPSLTKLKAAEKKLQVRRVFVRKGYTPKPTEANKLEVLRLSGRGRRGSSRV